MKTLIRAYKAVAHHILNKVEPVKRYLIMYAIFVCPYILITANYLAKDTADYAPGYGGPFMGGIILLALIGNFVVSVNLILAIVFSIRMTIVNDYNRSKLIMLVYNAFVFWVGSSLMTIMCYFVVPFIIFAIYHIKKERCFGLIDEFKPKRPEVYDETGYLIKK